MSRRLGRPSVFKMEWVWWMVLVGCASWGSPTIVNQGVIVEHYGDLAFSSQLHSVALTFNVQNITNQLGRLSKLVVAAANVAQEKPDTLTPYFVTETMKIARVINETGKDVQNFVRSFSDTSKKERAKRYTTLLGYFAGSILGLATDSEIDDLVSQINKEQTNTHSVLNQVISHLEVTDKQLDRLGKATNQIELAFIGLAHHIRQTDTLMTQLNKDVVLSQSINFMAFAAMDLQAEVSKILNAIESQVETFRLSPVFLSPDQFLEVLVKLQDSVALLFPPTPRFLSSFYDVSKVMVKKMGTRFIFLVRIPLKSDTLKFDLYRLNPLWHSAPNGSAWARKVDLDSDYLAVRKDSKYYTPLKDLGQCAASRSLTVCTPKHGFATSSNVDCMIALFRNDPSVNSVCPFSYKEKYSPSFVKVGNFWIASSPHALQANEVCPSKSTVISIPAGVSRIVMKDNCQIVGDEFRLPSFITSQQRDITIDIIPPLDFPDMPSPSQLQSTLKELKLDRIGSFSHTQIALIANQARITPHKLFPYRNVIIAILVTVGVLVGIGLIRVLMKLRHSLNCCGLAHLISTRNPQASRRSEGVTEVPTPRQPVVSPRPNPTHTPRIPPIRSAPLVPHNHQISEVGEIYQEMVGCVLFVKK